MDGFDVSLNARLTEDAELIALLPLFEEAPTIFLGPEVPPGAPREYIFIPQPDTNNPWESKVHRGREATRDIWIVGDNVGTWAYVQAIAARIHFLLHRKPLTFVDSNQEFRGKIATIFGPKRLDTDERLVGLTMTLFHRHTTA